MERNIKFYPNGFVSIRPNGEPFYNSNGEITKIEYPNVRYINKNDILQDIASIWGMRTDVPEPRDIKVVVYPFCFGWSGGLSVTIYENKEDVKGLFFDEPSKEHTKIKRRYLVLRKGELKSHLSSVEFLKRVNSDTKKVKENN